jgi:hypothetical protein
MKTQFTNTVAELIQYDAVSGPICRPTVLTEYYDESLGKWVEFDDITTRTISLSNENKRYGEFSFMPPSKSISFNLNNFDQKYSTGGASTYSNILKRNLKVRAWSGYYLTVASSENPDLNLVDDFVSNTKFVHTQATGSKVYYSPNFTGTVDEVLLPVTYDSTTYDATTYDYSGYYLKRFQRAEEGDVFNAVTINCSNNKFGFRYRLTESEPFTSTWSDFELLSTGANTKTISGATENDEYMQVAILFAPETFESLDYIDTNGVTLNREAKSHMFLRGTFLLDDPQFADLNVKCKGRDYIKKALETDVNLPDLTSTTSAVSVMQRVLDTCNIPYDATKWDDPNINITLTEEQRVSLQKTGWQVLDFLMDAVNANSNDWRLKTEEDGSISLKQIPTDIEADYNIHYFYNIESVNKSLDSDKQVQRIIASDESLELEAEEGPTIASNIAGTTGVLTDTVNFKLTFPTSIFVGSINVRLVFDRSAIPSPEKALVPANWKIDSIGSYADDYIYVTMNSALLGDPVDPTNIAKGFTVYYTPVKDYASKTYAVAENGPNTINKDGQTVVKVNPFFDQGMCNDFVEYFINKYGQPAKKVTLKMTTNPYLELNDNCLIFDLFTYTDDIYGITSIKESWKEPSLKDTITLEDRGFNLGLFQWDRNGVNRGINDLTYDNNFVWDQDLQIGGSDTRAYVTPIRMQTLPFLWDANGINPGSEDLVYDSGLFWEQDLPRGGSDTATYPRPILMQ